MLTTHLVLRGEITLQEEGQEKRTFKSGDRADVGANVNHEAWIGPEVCTPSIEDCVVNFTQANDFRAVHM